MTTSRLFGCFLLASVAMCGALASCANPIQPKPASAATKNPTVSVKGNFLSFDEASEALKKALEERGYDTSEGDHAVGNAESFLALPLNDNSAELRINTSWEQKQPLGSYTLLNDTVQLTSALGIARLDAKGVWVDCRGFQFEILSTDTNNAVGQILASIRNELGC